MTLDIKFSKFAYDKKYYSNIVFCNKKIGVKTIKNYLSLCIQNHINYNNNYLIEFLSIGEITKHILNIYAFLEINVNFYILTFFKEIYDVNDVVICWCYVYLKKLIKVNKS